MKTLIKVKEYLWKAMQRCHFALRRTARSLWRSTVASFIILSMVVPAFAAPTAPNALPTGGQVAAGSASINTSGSTMNINQSSQKAAINWQTFNIGQNAWVSFNQPNSSSIALNRVLSGDPSSIYGKMTANGQVFLLNPAGIIFGRSASVNVGGLVASTLNLNDSDFMNGDYNFYNAGGAGRIVNRGNITANDAGYIALLAPQVINKGIISARMGTVAIAAGDKVSLDFNGDGLINFTVNQGTVNALIKNKNLVEADGGQVIMSAKAADSLSSAVVNNEGVIQAQTIGNKNGVIMLMADMQNGAVKVSGTLDASAPNGGDGGSIETSAATVNIADNARITTLAPYGKNGTWLIDPTNFTIVSGSAGQTTSGIGASTLQSALGSGNISIQTSGTANGSDLGDIDVNANVAWNANKLTLTATNDVDINAVMTAGGTASLDLEPGSHNVNVGFNSNGSFMGQVNFPGRSGTGFLTINGNSYTVINSLGAAGSTTGADLQGMQGNLSGYYALGVNIDASATSTWNSSAGFVPIGTATPFTGVFDGLGNTISNLTINLPATSYVGFSGWNVGTISNVGLTNVNITGLNSVGGLAGFNTGTISNSYSTGAVSATNINQSGSIGGLAGYNNGGIINSYSTSTVSANGDSGDSGGYYVGGLVGFNDSSGSISNTNSTGAVSTVNSGGGNSVGGLVGYNKGSIRGSSSSSTVSTTGGGNSVGAAVGSSIAGLSGSISFMENSTLTVSSAAGGNNAGGLVGYNSGSISSSYSTGSVNATGGGNNVGGLAGFSFSNAPLSNSSFYVSTANITSVTGGDNVGGLVGWNNGGSINNSNSSSTISASGGGNNVGGLAGFSFSNSPVSNSYFIVAAANITNATGGSNVGGLVGWNQGGNISNSNSTGAVSATGGGGNNVGGLAGFSFSNNSSVSNAVFGVGTLSSGGTIGGAVSIGNSTAGNNVGGLVGWNQGGNISNSNSAGAVSTSGGAANSLGGAVGFNNTNNGNGTITNLLIDPGALGFSSITGNANADNVGGLVGRNASTSTSASITNSNSSSVVNAGGNSGYIVFAGGLAGYNSGSISGSYSTGAVSASGGGNNAGTLLNESWSGETVTGPSSFSYNTVSITGATGGNNVGGLVGLNDGGSISGSYSTDAVTDSGGGNSVGALTGFDYSGATVSGASAFSVSTASVTSVTGGDNVGGLVGWNLGNSASISNSYSTGSVTATGGGNSIGGLVGFDFSNATFNGASSLNVGTVSVTSATGGNNVAGLVGWNYNGSISNSYSASMVSTSSSSSGGGNSVGGLVGFNSSGSRIGSSSSSVGTINITDSTGGNNVGGLVGWNNGGSSSISNSYSTGTVTADSSAANSLGGLLGFALNDSNANLPTIVNPVGITSSMNGNNVGGLVGRHVAGSISDSYSAGAVTTVSSNDNIGGLVGYSSSIISNSFWDVTTSGMTVSAGGSGVIGLTNAQMMQSSSFSGWSIDDIGGTGNTWRIYNGDTYPLLRSFLTSATIASVDNSNLTYNGQAFSGGNSSIPGTSGHTYYGGNAQGAVDAGTYTISIYSDQQGYDFTGTRTGTLTINPAPLTVTANDASVTASGAAYSGGNGVGYRGFVNNQTVSALGGSLTYGGTSQGAASAGSYTIIPGGLTSGNYTITFVNGTLTINALPVTTTNVGPTVVTSTTTTIQTTQQQTTTTQNPTSISSAAGAPSGSGQTSFSGGLITVNTTSGGTTSGGTTSGGTTSGGTTSGGTTSGGTTSGGTTSGGTTSGGTTSGGTTSGGTTSGGTTSGGTGAGALSSGSVKLTVGGASMGNMTISDQGGTLTVAVAPSSGSASAAANTGATSTGALTIYTATDEGTRASGNFAINTGSGSVSLTQAPVAAEPITAAVPVTVAAGGSSATFSVTTADGVVLEYSVSQSGNTLSIQPANDAASKATGGTDKKLISAIGILAAEDKLGTSGAQINAVVIHENR